MRACSTCSRNSFTRSRSSGIAIPNSAISSRIWRARKCCLGVMSPPCLCQTLDFGLGAGAGDEELVFLAIHGLAVLPCQADAMVVVIEYDQPVVPAFAFDHSVAFVYPVHGLAGFDCGLDLFEGHRRSSSIDCRMEARP